ncbi:hypothetical protein HanIR_Chr02g0055661 [Helianthus annuus]|nr:hypothetical protein HanIR_Chr02g0055661 [Helianthus annuus]
MERIEKGLLKIVQHFTSSEKDRRRRKQERERSGRSDGDKTDKESSFYQKSQK